MLTATDQKQQKSQKDYVRTAHAIGDVTACMWHCFGHVSSQLSIMLSGLELVRPYYI